MALTSTEEALVRQLIDQQAAILSLAGSESTIISKLGATKVTIADLTSASVIGDTDLFLIRQGTTEKNVAGSVVKALASGAVSAGTESASGILELATAAETQAGSDNRRAVHPAGLSSVMAAVRGAYSNLRASADGVSANVSVSADEIVVSSSTNNYKTLRSVSLTIAGTSTGANGIDTGALASNAWYALYVIWNGTTTAGLMSLSATTPTMPSGYTHKARIGWIRTDSTGNKYPLSFIQMGSSVRYKIATGSNVPGAPLASSGSQGSLTTPTWVAVAIGAYVPSTAGKAVININGFGGYNAAAAPNNNYGAWNNASNPPPVVAVVSSGNGQSTVGELSLESTNIYWANNGGGNLYFIGWEDQL